MKTTFQILSQKDCVRYAYKAHNNTCAIISIVNSDEMIFPNFYKRKDNGVKGVLQLSFDDIQPYKGMEYWKKDENLIVEKLTDSDGFVYESRIYQLFTKKDAEKIYDFVLKWYDKVDLIIVHCSAGISRSAGVCAAIMKSVIGDDSPVWDNPLYHPNSLCYKLVLEEFMRHS